METKQTLNPDISKKIAWKNGLIMALISTILFLIVYYTSPSMLGNIGYSTIIIFLSIGIAIYFTIDIRKKIGGYWAFREALSAIFVMLLVNGLLYYFATIAFGKWVEPRYPELMKETGLNRATELYESLYQDQDKVDESIAQTEKVLESQFNPGPMDILKNLSISIIFYFIGALIFAAIFKRDRPIFFQTDDSQSYEG